MRKNRGKLPTKLDIMNEEWDFLIILDACRYDYFKEYYSTFFSGTLKKLISPASKTPQFLKNVFKDWYEDIVYISANPYVNSKGIPIKGFNAKDHFSEIIDVWKWGIDPNLGAVPPRTMNKATLETIEKFPNKKYIVHYMQPHNPYIIHGKLGDPSNFLLRKPDGKTFIDKVRNKLDSELKRYIGRHYLWKFKELLGYPPANDLEVILRKSGKPGLRKAYRENLKIALDAISDLVPELKGTVIITSDHGERLGEKNRYFHISGSKDPILREVPWFEIRNA